MDQFQLSGSGVKNFSFNESSISSHDKIKKLVDEERLSNKGKWIYVFCGNNLADLLKTFKCKRKKSTKKFSQANSVLDKSSCIYVGSSGEFKTRIKQHLGGFNSDSTYAVRFNEWLPSNEEITCFYFEVEERNQDFLQNLEDSISDQLCPILGKRGGK